MQGPVLNINKRAHQEKETLELQGFATKSNPPQLQLVGDTGFEPVTSAV